MLNEIVRCYTRYASVHVDQQRKDEPMEKSPNNQVGVVEPVDVRGIIESVFRKKDPNQDDIYLGISGVGFPVDHFDFGGGITLSKTYAHIFAPYLAAFKRPEKEGAHHPAPWKAISGGITFDITYELHIPLEFDLENWFDRLNTAWWFLSLLRMKGSSLLIAPVVSNFSFTQIGSLDLDANFFPIEFNTRRILMGDEVGKLIPLHVLEWVRKNWLSAGTLMNQDEDFNHAYQALDRAIHETGFSLALVTVWGALERLFADFKAELNYRIAVSIAAYLEPAGPRRHDLFTRVKKLYEARSKAAHGRPNEDQQEFKESYNLLRSAIVKIIETNHVPTMADIEGMVLRNDRSEGN